MEKVTVQKIMADSFSEFLKVCPLDSLGFLDLKLELNNREHQSNFECDNQNYTKGVHIVQNESEDIDWLETLNSRYLSKNLL